MSRKTQVLRITEHEVDRMKPGRVLDALVTEYVMGEPFIATAVDDGSYFSLKVSDAFRAIDKLMDEWEPAVFHDRRWACCLRRRGTDERVMAGCQIYDDPKKQEPDSPALAIARCALKAVMQKRG
jgi:hypothetical protein